MSKPENNHNCVVCLAPFKSHRSLAMYCSKPCQKKSARSRMEITSSGKTSAHLSASVKGAMHEHLVCYDLLKRGYAVFRSCTPSSSCDLLLMAGDCISRVEVRTVVLYNGKPVLGYAYKDLMRQDIIAAVDANAKIHYFMVTDKFPDSLVGQRYDGANFTDRTLAKHKNDAPRNPNRA